MTSTTYSTVFGHAEKSIKAAFYLKNVFIYLFSRCLAKVYKYFYITDVINLLLQKNKKCFSSYAKAQAGWGEKGIVQKAIVEKANISQQGQTTTNPSLVLLKKKAIQ